MTITINSAPIIKTEIDGKTYYNTVARGVEYCAYFMESAGQWFVSSHRLALGRHIGGGKYYASLDSCKPFAALPALMKMGAL